MDSNVSSEATSSGPQRQGVQDPLGPVPPNLDWNRILACRQPLIGGIIDNHCFPRAEVQLYRAHKNSHLPSDVLSTEIPSDAHPRVGSY